MLIGPWNAVFVVPALILQYRPKSRAWFRVVNEHHTAPPSRRTLRTRTDDGLPDGDARFLVGAVTSREPLVHAADVDEAGNLIADKEDMIQPWMAEGTAWKVISR